MLDIFFAVRSTNGGSDQRFRIEHAQHLRPLEISRIGAMGVIPSMQPYHAIDDGRWAEGVIGPERAQHTYAFRSLLDAGARLTFGSDSPVAPPEPLYGIYAALTRQTLDGAHPDGWVPEQKISLEEALTAYTLSGAYASFDEGEKGTLAAGKLADIVILDQDLTQIPAEAIKDVKVLRTIVGGRTVFERE